MSLAVLEMISDLYVRTVHISVNTDIMLAVMYVALFTKWAMRYLLIPLSDTLEAEQAR